MARPVAFVLVVMAIVASGAFSARLPAQQQAPAQTELLNEVRLLRQAIESLAGTNARVQIVFGRLQLQDQRTAGAARRLDEARTAVAKLAADIGGMSDRSRELENIIADGRGRPEELSQARAELTDVKRQIERMDSDRARLAGEEAEASGVFNQEQGRWSDLNRQLEELERALTKPQ